MEMLNNYDDWCGDDAYNDDHFFENHAFVTMNGDDKRQDSDKITRLRKIRTSTCVILMY